MVGGDEEHAEGQPRPRESAVDPGTMLDGVDEAVVVLDDDGRVTYANETAADLLGCPTSDLVGRDPFRGDSAVASTEVAARCRAAMETEEREAFEAYCEPLDAWLAVRPVPVEQGLVVYLRDVTDQRASARAVRLQEQRLRAVFESTSDVMVMKDREGRYQLVNGAAASALDRPKSDVLGRTDRELFGPDVGEQMRERDRTVLETERSTTDEETLPTADGDRVYRATRVPYSGPDGDLLRDARTRKWITTRSFPLGAVLRGGRQVERGDVLVNRWTELRGHAELALGKTAAGAPLRAVGGNVSGPLDKPQGVWEKNRGPLVPTNRYAPEQITRPRY
jgi:PAS domain S-box-containing protein